MKKGVVILLSLAVFGLGVFLGSRFLGGKGSTPALPYGSPLSSVPDSLQGSGEVASFFRGQIIEVKDGESIQEAVGKANPGDLIRIYPGTYHETVYIDKDDISVQGVREDGEWATLDGKGELNDAILYSGNGVLIENMKIMNYKGNGIMGQAGNNFVIRNNWVFDTGVYGIFPEFGKNGLVSHNVLSGIEDAAIYVGMCDNIDVRNNEVFNSVAGIEIENCRYALVEDNYIHDNTGGILTFITPGLPIKTCKHVIIRNNFVMNNNHVNFGQEGSLVASLPRGTGIIVMAADSVYIENNIIAGNNNVGVVVSDLSFGAQISKDAEVDPTPEHVVILDNVMMNNGSDPVDDVKLAMATQLKKTGPDLIGNGKSTGCIRNPQAYTSFGLGHFTQCDAPSTSSIKSYLLPEPYKPLELETMEKGKLAFYGVCSGCHAYDINMIGPPVQVIQALYKDNPKGLAEYINNPVKKRDDYPEMPPQNYLSEETRMAVAEYVLSIGQMANKGMGRYSYHSEELKEKSE